MFIMVIVIIVVIVMVINITRKFIGLAGTGGLLFFRVAVNKVSVAVAARNVELGDASEHIGFAGTSLLLLARVAVDVVPMAMATGKVVRVVL